MTIRSINELIDAAEHFMTALDWYHGVTDDERDYWLFWHGETEKRDEGPWAIGNVVTQETVAIDFDDYDRGLDELLYQIKHGDAEFREFLPLDDEPIVRPSNPQ